MKVSLHIESGLYPIRLLYEFLKIEAYFMYFLRSV